MIISLISDLPSPLTFKPAKAYMNFFYELFSLKSCKWRGYDFILSNVFKVGSNKVF